ncbi:MAG: DUF3786 domain-containing protein [Victivallaceae bacterium]|nr:DUF3786 domain-containing protein [Victivallaceae bacterium]
MSKQDALDKAIEMAIEKLSAIDLNHRLKTVNLPPKADNTVAIRMFGGDMLLNITDFSLTNLDGKAAKPADRLLLLHYLGCEFHIKKTGELMPFREFTGGQFYLEPFLSRSVQPLAKRFGNDLDSLKKNLNRFDWVQTDIGDFAAVIKTIGEVDVTLVYRLGNDEFAPEAELFFDSCTKKIFNAEDAAVLAGRICFGLF